MYMDNIKKNNEDRIVLFVLPMLDPLIPPQGVVFIKTYLKEFGYEAKVCDANTDDELLQLYYDYFEILKRNIPEERQGNIFNIGLDVWRNHLMAYINKVDEGAYDKLFGEIIKNTFFIEADKDLKLQLDGIAKLFFYKIKAYVTSYVEEYNSKYVGLSAFKGNLPACIYAARIIKKLNKDIQVIIGGGVFADQLAIGSEDLEYFKKSTEAYIDKIIIGEGEKPFLKIIRGEHGNKRVFTPDDMNNTFMSFSEMKIPDMDDLHIDKYQYMASFASVSCPFECSFCNEVKYHGKYRKKMVDSLLNEKVFLYNKYGFQNFFMLDALLNPIVDELSEKVKKNNLPFYYDAYLRVEKSIPYERALKWRNGGFYRARLGIESGSQNVLDMMGKKITPEMIRQSVTNLANAGIKTTTFWVIGHPGETEEDFNKTLELLEELKDYIWQAECNPFTYHYTGQTCSDIWSDKRRLVYNEEYREMLMSQTWALDIYPQREIIYDRLNRFVMKRKELGIPDPYTIVEINEADQRWHRLHSNAVTPLLELLDFRNRFFNQKIQQCNAENNMEVDIDDFNF